MTTPHTREERRAVAYCADCGRIKGVGCACGLSFKERAQSQSMVLPSNFRAAR